MLGVLVAAKCCSGRWWRSGRGAVQRQFIVRCCGVVSEDPQGPPLLFVAGTGVASL